MDAGRVADEEQPVPHQRFRRAANPHDTTSIATHAVHPLLKV